MFDWFRPVVGNYSIDVKCSNNLCNNSVIVPAQINANAVIKCEFCKEAEIELKPHYKWSWKLNKAVRL